VVVAERTNEAHTREMANECLTTMQIRVGYELIYDCPQQTPMCLRSNCGPLPRQTPFPTTKDAPRIWGSKSGFESHRLPAGRIYTAP
jgi:hypothetical protein